MLLPPAVAAADDTVSPQQHNVTYRARVDGISRGALITYRISDTQINSANPTMLPGRTFETTAVLTDPKEAGMRISIQWPYSANLHCEIIVDDQLFVQASQFISPRLTPAKDDPDFGAINCGAPLSNAYGAPVAPAPVDPVAPAPVDTAAPSPAPAIGAPGAVPPPASDQPTVPPAEGAPAVPPPPGPPPGPILPGEGPPLDSLPVNIPPVPPPAIVPQTDPTVPIT